MIAARRLILAAIAPLCSCVAPTQAPAPAPLPAPAHAYTIAAVDSAGHTRFATCASCPRPTPKTLPGLRVATASPPPAAPPASEAPASRPVAPATADPTTRRLIATLQFDHDSAVLTPAARKQVTALAPLLRQARRLQVTGYTDSLGSQPVNLRLSDARALAVVLALRTELDGLDRVPTLTGTGRPLCCYVADNRSANTRQLNRRAEVAITVDNSRGLAVLIASLRSQWSLRDDGAEPAESRAATDNAAVPATAATSFTSQRSEVQHP